MSGQLHAPAALPQGKPRYPSNRMRGGPPRRSGRFCTSLFPYRDRGSTMVKVLCYRSESRWFDPSCCQYNPSDRTMALGSTQPLTEMSTRSISWGKGGRCVRLTTYYHPGPLSRNLGTLTSWNPLGLSRPAKRLFYLYIYIYIDR